MKKISKLVFSAMTAIMLFGVVGCSTTKSEAPPPAPEPVVEPVPEPAPEPEPVPPAPEPAYEPKPDRG